MQAVDISGGIAVPLSRIEVELNRQLNAGQGAGEAPTLRAHMANLIVYCNAVEQARLVDAAVQDIIAVHPARVLLLVSEQGEMEPVTAAAKVLCQSEGGRRVCSEQVTLHSQGYMGGRLAYAVRELLIGDLPTNLWWVAPVPPPLAGQLPYELAQRTQQIVYDSNGWPEPARGVAVTAAWLDKFEKGAGQGWRVVSDLNWRRLKYWRRVLGQTLDPNTAPGALETISEVLVEHGPHAVVQAWELVSWLASRLNWHVQRGRIEPNVEITWQVAAPQGALRVRIHRLAEGPSEVRRVRIACQLEGKPAAFNIVVEDEKRLSAHLEGVSGAPRTVTIQPQVLAELVGRQLSDRERDPVFRESMAVAQVFAQSVLG
jgi:glucose-6-phosphate dehydrogenase assembly protein OpcA